LLIVSLASYSELIVDNTTRCLQLSLAHRTSIAKTRTLLVRSLYAKNGSAPGLIYHFSNIPNQRVEAFDRKSVVCQLLRQLGDTSLEAG
jgi:hypothetical protein